MSISFSRGYTWKSFKLYGGLIIGKFGLAINNNKSKPHLTRYGHPAPMKVLSIWGLALSWKGW